MSLITPLGFLGLIGLAVLLLIYLIKPNYQQKAVSSTFVWKMSLKYKKKRIPISKLRNLLILLLQIIIITACAFLLAQPVIAEKDVDVRDEKIVIIDASASMLVQVNNVTRFERAVLDAHDYVRDKLDEGYTVSIILANNDMDYLAYRVNNSSKSETLAKINETIENADNFPCYTGNVEMEKVMDMAQGIIDVNPKTEVVLFTGTKYYNTGNVTVVDVSDADEWNVAIHGCKAEIVENLYEFTVDVASYGLDKDVKLDVLMSGVNNNLELEFSQTERLVGDAVHTVKIFPVDVNGDSVGVYSFDSITVSVVEDDSLISDNTFKLFGGIKPTLKIQYYSPAPNTYFSLVLMTISDALRDKWNIEIKEVRNTAEPANTGFDIYIFEHALPVACPSDGIVFLVNVSKIPSELGITVKDVVQVPEDKKMLLSLGAPHPLTSLVDAGSVQLTRYLRVSAHSPEYDELMFCAGEPVMLCRNEQQVKICAMMFSVNFSDFSVSAAFPTFMYNFFSYYTPTTIDKYVYTAGEDVVLNSRSGSLNVKGPKDLEIDLSQFPYVLNTEKTGTYTLIQTTLRNEEITENFFVKAPDEASNITRVVDVLVNPIIEVEKEDVIYDLLVYFAAVIVVLLIAERLLYSRTEV